MIWSVSTLVRRSGTPMPVCVVNFSIVRPPGDRVGATVRSAGLESVPRTAVAAATSGLTRWVRPPLPCRPSKLRFDVDALRSPGASWSGFIPRHIEQPAQPPLGAGGGEDVVEALGLGLQADPSGTRDDEHADAVGDPVALDDVGCGAQVLDPTVRAGAEEDRVDLDVTQRRPGLEAHVREGPLGGGRSPSSANDSGSGTLADSGRPWPGLVPHVTKGVSAAASRWTTVSNSASSSLRSSRHDSTARSQSSPCGACGRPLR